MADSFTYDVFLSHNSQDKPRVRKLAERLKKAGLRVWFDDWVIKPGDDIYLAIERGLEAARVQVLCLSPAALGSEWVTLERSTVLFRDPTNAGRRFVPLLLADCTLPDTLRRYKYVDFRQETPAAFDELLAACREEAEAAPPAPQPRAEEETGEAEAQAGEAAGAGRAAGRAGTQAHGAQGLGQQRGRQPGWKMGGVWARRRQDGQDLGPGDRRMPGDAGRAYGSGADPSRSRRMGSGFCRGRIDNTVRVWDAGSGREVAKLEGHTSRHLVRGRVARQRPRAFRRTSTRRSAVGVGFGQVPEDDRVRDGGRRRRFQQRRQSGGDSGAVGASRRAGPALEPRNGRMPGDAEGPFGHRELRPDHAGRTVCRFGFG